MPKFVNDSRELSAADMCKLLDISRRTLSRRVKRGDVKQLKIRGRYVYFIQGDLATHRQDDIDSVPRVDNRSVTIESMNKNSIVQPSLEPLVELLRERDAKIEALSAKVAELMNERFSLQSKLEFQKKIYETEAEQVKNTFQTQLENERKYWLKRIVESLSSRPE